MKLKRLGDGKENIFHQLRTIHQLKLYQTRFSVFIVLSAGRRLNY